MSLELNCFFGGDRSPTLMFTIEIEGTKTVSSFKKAIKHAMMHTFQDLDGDALEIFKVSIPVDDGLDAKLKCLPLEHNPQNGVYHLSPFSRLREVFGDPTNGHLHVIVGCPPAASSKQSALGKHKLEDYSEKSKRLKTGGVLPTEAQISVLHKAIQQINENASWYSNPANFGSLPFLSGQVPNRFDLDDTSSFTYMGREAFAKVWKDVRSLKVWRAYARIYVEGTMGYGKSHILAALAAFLSRSGKRPVYIPDCRELLKDDVPCIHSSLLTAFSAPSLTSIRDEIRAFESRDDLLQFCRSQPPEHPLYFIIDQKNALDPEEGNKHTTSNFEKHQVSSFLKKIAIGHYTISSASANYNTAMEMISRQCGEMTLSLKGGMSREEMDEWWRHWFQEADPIRPDAKARIEYLTGRIPLLLRPVLRLFRDGKFEHVDKFEELLLRSRELVDVGGNIRSFARMINDHPSPTRRYDHYIRSVYGCLTSTVISAGEIPLPSIDHRYFYFDQKDVGHCTCGVAWEVASDLIRKGISGSSLA